MTNVTLPSSPEDRKKIRQALQEISDSLTRIEAERDLIKDILQTVEDNFELPKKYTRKVAKIYHKQNINEVKAENEELETIYETVTGV
jgi:siroheme synthase (precorrin-2 oxidase/ferrochelatase)